MFRSFSIVQLLIIIIVIKKTGFAVIALKKVLSNQIKFVFEDLISNNDEI